jgi:DNA-binding PadR family transcriptional regulator
MLTDLYILGFVARLGPLHGYSLKKAIEAQASDFAAIKLPTLYHHLAGLQKRGLVRAKAERGTPRPDRTTFEITKAGESHLAELVAQTARAAFRPQFDFDAVLFFADRIEAGELLTALKVRGSQITKALAILGEHREGTLASLAGQSRALAESIFSHHQAHFVAEREWVEQTIRRIRKQAKVASKKE